ncbi:reductive dehalogenase [Dethiobacter alkaliphilus]|uniref:reductive dehalogenase n=1 Tax=Dethiobacter alkaliphilus TaxID=427926 RepID=UPI00222710B9|nr:reductive dehalogenase [Dethiobacter alkaliphilus]MCW3490589.1 reductive dehalogenase [Dethiobacter alkaliphilus]
MIPRKQYVVERPGYEVNKEEYRRFPVHKQAFVTVSEEDTGEKVYMGWIEKMQASAQKNMMRNLSGRTVVDYAVNFGANTVNLILGEYGFPNSHFLKWDPLYIPEPMTEHPVEMEPEKLTKLVKETSELYGADLVGVTELDEKWVYSEDHLSKPFVFADTPRPKETEDAFVIPKSVNRAILIAVAMDAKMIETSPEVTASTSAAVGYSRMGITAVSLAEFIRSLGYVAIPCMNDTTMSIPLAIDAGLGEVGRHGLLITPEFGSNVRLCKVLTNMPLIPDKPIHMGLTEFCHQCMLCAVHCPANAITKENPSFSGVCKNNNPGVKKWQVRSSDCLRFWQQNGADCINCIAVCPFTYGYEWSQCMECVRCDTTHGCALHITTHLREKHGYVKDAYWWERPTINPLTRKGL